MSGPWDSSNYYSDFVSSGTYSTHDNERPSTSARDLQPFESNYDYPFPPSSAMQAAMGSGTFLPVGGTRSTSSVATPLMRADRGTYYCKTCDVDLDTEQDLRRHCKGIKHSLQCRANGVDPEEVLRVALGLAPTFRTSGPTNKHPIPQAPTSSMYYQEQKQDRQQHQQQRQKLPEWKQRPQHQKQQQKKKQQQQKQQQQKQLQPKATSSSLYPQQQQQQQQNRSPQKQQRWKQQQKQQQQPQQKQQPQQHRQQRSQHPQLSTAPPLLSSAQEDTHLTQQDLVVAETKQMLLNDNVLVEAKKMQMLVMLARLETGEGTLRGEMKKIEEGKMNKNQEKRNAAKPEEENQKSFIASLTDSRKEDTWRELKILQGKLDTLKADSEKRKGEGSDMHQYFDVDETIRKVVTVRNRLKKLGKLKAKDVATLMKKNFSSTAPGKSKATLRLYANKRAKEHANIQREIAQIHATLSEWFDQSSDDPPHEEQDPLYINPEAMGASDMQHSGGDDGSGWGHEGWGDNEWEEGHGWGSNERDEGLNIEWGYEGNDDQEEGWGNIDRGQATNNSRQGNGGNQNRKRPYQDGTDQPWDGEQQHGNQWINTGVKDEIFSPPPTKRPQHHRSPSAAMGSANDQRNSDHPQTPTHVPLAKTVKRNQRKYRKHKRLREQGLWEERKLEPSTEVPKKEVLEIGDTQKKAVMKPVKKNADSKPAATTVKNTAPKKDSNTMQQKKLVMTKSNAKVGDRKTGNSVKTGAAKTAIAKPKETLVKSSEIKTDTNSSANETEATVEKPNNSEKADSVKDSTTESAVKIKTETISKEVADDSNSAKTMDSESNEVEVKNEKGIVEGTDSNEVTNENVTDSTKGEQTDSEIVTTEPQVAIQEEELDKPKEEQGTVNTEEFATSQHEDKMQSDSGDKVKEADQMEGHENEFEWKEDWDDGEWKIEEEWNIEGNEEGNEVEWNEDWNDGEWNEQGNEQEGEEMVDPVDVEDCDQGDYYGVYRDDDEGDSGLTQEVLKGLTYDKQLEIVEDILQTPRPDFSTSDFALAREEHNGKVRKLLPASEKYAAMFGEYLSKVKAGDVCFKSPIDGQVGYRDIAKMPNTNMAKYPLANTAWNQSIARISGCNRKDISPRPSMVRMGVLQDWEQRARDNVAIVNHTEHFISAGKRLFEMLQERGESSNAISGEEIREMARQGLAVMQGAGAGLEDIAANSVNIASGSLLARRDGQIHMMSYSTRFKVKEQTLAPLRIADLNLKTIFDLEKVGEMNKVVRDAKTEVKRSKAEVKEARKQRKLEATLQKQLEEVAQEITVGLKREAEEEDVGMQNTAFPDDGQFAGYDMVHNEPAQEFPSYGNTMYNEPRFNKKAMRKWYMNSVKQGKQWKKWKKGKQGKVQVNTATN